MDSFLLSVYLREILTHSQSCIAAVGELNAVLQNPQDRRDLFRPCREVIYEAALISKLLWPPGSNNRKSRDRAFRRGEALRQALGVQGDHPIRGRSLRDHFEHYDERLDAWAEESRNRNIVQRLVGPRSSIGGTGIGDGDIIEHYDPATNLLAFRGEAFDIQALVNAVQDIQQKAATVLQSQRGA